MPSNIYTVPAPNAGFARSACLASFSAASSGVLGSGYLALATYEVDWGETEGIWTFNQVTLASIASTSGRYIDSATDGVSGFYVLGDTGPLVHVPTISGTPTFTTLGTNPSFAYTGLTYNPHDGNPYFIGYDGTIYKSVSGTVSTITAPPGGVAQPARWLYADASNNLYTMFSSSNTIGKYAITGATWTLTTSPFNSTLDTISYSSSVSAVIVGGSNLFTLTDAATILDITYTLNPTQLLIADNTPAIKVYTLTTGGFVFAQNISTYSGTPHQLAAEPDGNQAIVTDLTNNRLEILTYTGSWAQTSTVALTGPTNIVISTDSGITQALVCQPSNNTISVLNKSLNTWAVVQTLSIAGPTNIAVTTSGGQITGIVTTSTGVEFLNFNGAVWTLVGSQALSPVPTQAAADANAPNNPLLYVAGATGGNTTVTIFENGTQIGTYTISGTVSTLEVIDWQILVPMTTGTLNIGYCVLVPNGTAVTGNSVNAAAVQSGGVSMAWIPSTVQFFPTLVSAGPNTIWTFYSNAPQSFVRETDSLVAVLSGSGGSFTTKKAIQYAFMPLNSRSGTASGLWSVLDLLDRNKVSSITTDPSKNIYAVTTDNDFYRFNSSGTLVNGYPYAASPPIDQEEFTDLGFSKLVFWNGKLVSASSLSGGLLILTP